MNIQIKPRKINRIVCLTEETTETLYKLGADDLIAGITEYTVRPEKAKLEKPVIAKYIDADIEGILSLNPDIVFAWSDMQADIVKELVKNGIEVYCFNHRSVQGILEMILKVGAITGYQDESIHLVAELTANIEKAETLSRRLKVRPKVYFEEWFKPLITGIRWVSESIEICGGDDIFPEHRKSHNAKGRILEDDSKIIIRNPDIILASWCGKPFRKQKLLRRDNWDSINAVKSDSVFEIDSAVILQPGPAVLSDGLEILSKIFIEWADRHGELIDNYN